MRRTEMQRLPQRPSLDVACGQCLEQRSAVRAGVFGIHEDRVHPIGRRGPRGLPHRPDPGQLSKGPGVLCGDAALRSDEGWKLLELRTTDPCLHNRQPVVVAYLATHEVPELAWVELPIVWIHVDEGRPGPHVTDGISRGDEAERWQNNLVAGPHASHEKSRVKRRRAAGRGNGMRHS